MASFDNLVNSLSNNPSNSTSPAPVKGPLISDLARAQIASLSSPQAAVKEPLISDLAREQIANANMSTQQAITAVQQAQDMQRHIGMNNHVQDYAFVVVGLSILLIMIFLKKVIGKK